jgi:hypothetical protein
MSSSADCSVVNMREKGRFVDFTLNMGLPSWRYELDGIVIETSIVVPSRQNIVHCTFRSLGDGQPVRLRLRPLINFRALETPVADALSSARLRFARLAMEPRLLRRGGPQGLPIDADRGDGAPTMR